MRLPGARALPVEAETRLRRCCASSTELLALPENINREPPRPPQEVAHLIREPVRKSGALTLRISSSYAGRRLELRECFDGRLLAFADDACLATQPPPPAFVLRPRHQPSADRARRRRASPSPTTEGGRYPPPSPKRSFSSPRSAAAARKPSPAHPWRHSTPYSPRSKG